MFEWYEKDKKEVLNDLQTSEKGLTKKQANERLIKYGENTIKEIYQVSKLKILLTQLNSFLMYILIFAGIISIIITHYLDAGVIFFTIAINVTIGYFQQYKAEKAIKELKKLLVPRVKVMRDGKLMIILSSELVPGDLIIYEAGDTISADCYLLETENLQVDESVLTGESLPIKKSAGVIPKKKSITDIKNMLFTGTNIVSGNCKAIVTSTGMQTEFGKIASLLQDIKIPKTPIQKKLDKFAKQISVIIIFFALIIILIGIYEGINTFDMFLTAVALSVSAIPEGLPAIVAFTLAITTIAMANNKALIRRLPAAETLGEVTVICSDKTGTLTQEKMMVRELFTNNKFFKKEKNDLFYQTKRIVIKNQKEIFQLLKIGILCNNARFEFEESLKSYNLIGDATEQALVLAALELGINKKTATEQEPSIKEISFSSERKMMSKLRKGNINDTLYVKGASKQIIEKCAFEFIDGNEVKLSQERKNDLLVISEQMESKALRVLAFAFRKVAKNENKDLEKGLIFTGFIGMIDPPRPEIKDSINLCKLAGIKVKMNTGDSPLTAKAIAEEVGIIGNLMTGEEISKYDDERLRKEMENIGIFARIDPQQKLRIVNILKNNGETIAITGDGVNDVLALKKADIGIAMGIRGSDAAREVSDMVLLDDNFHTIVKAVEEGRIVYSNTKKFLKFLIGVNLSEIILIAYALLYRHPLPLLPIQILWMNIVTSTIPALTLSFEREKNTMSKPPIKEKNIMDNIILFTIFSGLIASISEIAVFVILLNKNYPIESIRTIVLTSGILFTLFFIFVCRSDKSIFRTNFFSNRWLFIAVSLTILIHLIMVYTNFGKIFGLVPITFNDLLFIMPFSISGLVLFELYKLLFNKKK